MTAIKPSEYTCVIELAGQYTAMHVNGRGKAFISTHAETDLKIAKRTARDFAAAARIPLKKGILYFTKPIVSVCQKNGMWYPVTIESDKITSVSTEAEGYQNKESALAEAEVCATIKNLPFIPQACGFVR